MEGSEQQLEYSGVRIEYMGQYFELIRERLDTERFEHSLLVAQTAKELARHNGLDPQQAYIAGILHDYAKNMGDGELLRIAQEQQLLADEVERDSPFLLHGPVGAYLVEQELAIGDREILEAICYHTTGKPQMGKLAQVIYIADLIEPQRNFPGVEVLRQTTYDNLTKGVLMGLNITLRYVLEKNQPIHNLSVQTRNWLLRIVKE